MLLLPSFIVGLVLGSYLGLLITQYFNNGVNPMTLKINEVSQYEILKEFEEEE